MNGPWGQLGPSEVLRMEKGRWKVQLGGHHLQETPFGFQGHFSPLGEKISGGLGGTATPGEAPPSFPAARRGQI